MALPRILGAVPAFVNCTAPNGRNATTGAIKQHVQFFKLIDSAATTAIASCCGRQIILLASALPTSIDIGEIYNLFLLGNFICVRAYLVSTYQAQVPEIAVKTLER